jgi:Uma2 family endonuclease
MAEARLTLAEFLARPATDPAEEFVGGIVVPKPALAEREQWLRSDLATLLFGWARASREGAAALSVRCALGPDVYVPDVAYVAPGRLANLSPSAGMLTVPPDLAIEICPASIDPAWFARRLDRYLAHGVRLGWLVDAAEQTVTVSEPAQQPVTLGRGSVLEGSDVLPGFYVHLDDLFDTLAEEAYESR